MGKGTRILDAVLTLGASELVRKGTGKSPLESLTGHKGTPGKGLDEELALFASEILADSRDTRNTYFGQLEDAITKGRVAGLEPAQGRAVEAALVQGSDEQNALKDQLAGGNLVQTPFGQKALASSRLVSEQRAATAPQDLINQFFLQAPAATLGQAQTIGLENANAISEIGAAVQRARTAARASAIGSVATGAGGLAGLGLTSYLNYQGAQPTTTAAPRNA